MNQLCQHIIPSKIIADILLIVLLVLFSVTPSISQDLTFSRYVTTTKISDTDNRDVLEDQFGFIWFGGNRLHKYDGYRSKLYPLRAQSPDSTRIGKVRCMLENKQSDIWIGANNGFFKYIRSIDKIITYLPEQLKNKEGNRSLIYTIHEDSQGRLWLGGIDKVFCVSALEETLIHEIANIDLGSIYHQAAGARAIGEDSKGNIWIASTNGLWKIGNDFSATQYLPDNQKNNSKDYKIIDLEIDSSDVLWLVTPQGLTTFDSRDNSFLNIALPGSFNTLPREIMIDDDNQIWIATRNNIFFRRSDGTIQLIAGQPSYLFKSIQDLYKDRFGNLWTAENGGVNKLELYKEKYLQAYRVANGPTSQDNYFYRVMEDSSGGIWLRMYRSGGLGYSRKLDGSFEVRLQLSENYFIDEIKDFCTDKDQGVWVITLTNGLYHFERGAAEGVQFDLGDSIRNALPLQVIADSENIEFLWVSTKFGLLRVNRFTKDQKWYTPNDDLPWMDCKGIGLMAQSEDGNIWCSFTLKGKQLVGHFDKEKEAFFVEKSLPSDFKTGSFHQLSRVSDSEIWGVCNNGVILINTETKVLSLLTHQNGLPVRNPKSAEADDFGNVWLTDGKQICKYNKKQSECFIVNGAVKRLVNTSSTKLADGRMAFGGISGLMVFDPQEVRRDSFFPTIYLTGLNVMNKPRRLKQAYELTKEITLPYEENFVSFEYAALNFPHDRLLPYRHKLEGFEQEWVNNKTDLKATYTNLPPGKYTFRVGATGFEGHWVSENNELKIQLIILPPWYRTWWAYSSYVLIIGGILYWFYRFQLERKLAENEANRQKELHQTKSRLFTNITHEFRTPLTVILGMVDQVKSDPQNWFNEGLHLIHRNGKQLLRLVNQLLDLSKLESGHMTLKLIHGDVVRYLHYLTESFHSYAESKDIRLHFTSDVKKLEMDYDEEKLQNVFSNLVSNAIKFTQAGGDVYIQLSLEKKSTDSHANQLILAVKDNGPGIPQEQLSHIFDRFYQVDATTTRQGEGTGIGLALTKELVQLMGGRIEIESELESGSKFTISLPVMKFLKSNVFTTPVPSRNDTEDLELKTVQYLPKVSKEDLPMVLLIEDNPDVITYLSSFLSNEYIISTSSNGKQGVEKAIQLTPDLVVSDVMMPEMDGFEVCELLKEDERTSHIPIILLTAKSDTKAKLEGLSHGADAYLAKPFNKEELLIRIEKLIELRRHLQKYYKETDDLLKVAKKPKPTLEEIFLQKLIKIVEENYADELFGSADLCRKAGLSRSQLFRKLKAITGRSTTNFIRSIRLAKGKELLESTDMTVSEVSFLSGFNNLNYFSKMFKEEFGVSPSEIRKHES